MTKLAREPKLSKNGWPLGKFEHVVTTCHKRIAPALIAALAPRFGIKDTTAIFSRPLRTHLGEGEHTFEDVIVNAKLSMETYGLMREFCAGFKAASY